MKEEKNIIDKHKLDTILEITKKINFNASTEEILESFIVFLNDSLNVQKISLYIHQYEKWYCLINKFIQDRNTEVELPFDFIHTSEITPITANENNFFKGYDVLIPIFHKAEPLAYLLIGDFNSHEKGLSPSIKHIGFIQTLANIIVVAIENKRLAKETIAKEAIKTEIELATKMQNMLFPSTLPDDENLQIAAHYQPYSGLGGDYYDFQVMNKNEVFFCVADVSGKGVSAALLMANFQANLRAYMATKDNFKEVIEILNKTVIDSAKGEKFITCFLAVYDISTRKLAYVNAGHHPALLYSSKNKDVKTLSKGCVGVGMLNTIPKFETGAVFVETGDLLVAYTDGLVEVENELEEQFDYKKLSKIITDCSLIDMKSMNEKILKEADKFRKDIEFNDDITLLSVKFK